MYIKKFRDEQEFYKLAQVVGAQGVANMIKARMIDEQATIQLNQWVGKLKSRAIELSSFNDGNNTWEEVLYIPSFDIEDANEFFAGVQYCANNAYEKPIRLLEEAANDYHRLLLEGVIVDYIYNRKAYIAAREVLALLK